ncbi:MAG: sensor histidine kinase [Candidatus Hodarchaeota archaeon]
MSRSRYYKISRHFIIIFTFIMPYSTAITNLGYFLAILPMTSIAVVVIAALLYDTKTTIIISLFTIFLMFFFVILIHPIPTPPRNIFGELLFFLIGVCIFVVLNSFFLNSQLNKAKEYSIQLEKLAQERRNLDQLRSNFISMTSHELQTPLTVIKGYLSFFPRIKENRRDERTTQIQMALDKNVARLEGLVNRIGEITRFERDIFQLEDTFNFLNS